MSAARRPRARGVPSLSATASAAIILWLMAAAVGAANVHPPAEAAMALPMTHSVSGVSPSASDSSAIVIPDTSSPLEILVIAIFMGTLLFDICCLAFVLATGGRRWPPLRVRQLDAVAVTLVGVTFTGFGVLSINRFFPYFGPWQCNLSWWMMMSLGQGPILSGYFLRMWRLVVIFKRQIRSRYMIVIPMVLFWLPSVVVSSINTALDLNSPTIIDGVLACHQQNSPYITFPSTVIFLVHFVVLLSLILSIRRFVSPPQSSQATPHRRLLRMEYRRSLMHVLLSALSQALFMVFWFLGAPYTWGLLGRLLMVTMPFLFSQTIFWTTVGTPLFAYIFNREAYLKAFLETLKIGSSAGSVPDDATDLPASRLYFCCCFAFARRRGPGSAQGADDRNAGGISKARRTSLSAIWETPNEESLGTFSPHTTGTLSPGNLCRSPPSQVLYGSQDFARADLDPQVIQALAINGDPIFHRRMRLLLADPEVVFGNPPADHPQEGDLVTSLSGTSLSGDSRVSSPDHSPLACPNCFGIGMASGLCGVCGLCGICGAYCNASDRCLAVASSKHLMLLAYGAEALMDTECASPGVAGVVEQPGAVGKAPNPPAADSLEGGSATVTPIPARLGPMASAVNQAPATTMPSNSDCCSAGGGYKSNCHGSHKDSHGNHSDRHNHTGTQVVTRVSPAPPPTATFPLAATSATTTKPSIHSITGSMELSPLSSPSHPPGSPIQEEAIILSSGHDTPPSGPMPHPGRNIHANDGGRPASPDDGSLESTV
ncbi:hypothetical protein H696_03057 [Fonticula alba]|uniref:G-protein coupled receptors family 1 profile domain-containing protein n=1 Tax=Fonticula alba TaxID=691883 RepID=A0A058Z8R7_FONAL|nr:hypothetical protein H696_03057 [Fonticula alba]KCV70704.1 hypothetical protein H696_03057 [Fonticula alba]|eukprot:XP_009495220.1 hypothetical protein H696_03057 [Fonticula alba]